MGTDGRIDRLIDPDTGRNQVCDTKRKVPGVAGECV